jgi:excinuclease ABC subunit C
MDAAELTFPAPSTPGVYLFRGPKGDVLYVGKSRDLKRRVLDHLHVRTEKDAFLVSNYARVEFLPTKNEREALLLEASLVREYQPRYNVLLKDDKSYPYVSLTLGDKFPRVSMVRRPKKQKGQVLFGPYMHAREARSLVKVLAEAFLLRRCRVLPMRACIYYHMGTCSAPCIGAIDEEHYRERVEKSLMVLRGKAGEVVPWVEGEMKKAASRQEFERAAILRDALGALENLKDRQRVIMVGGETMDVVAVATSQETPSKVAVGVVKVRDGEVVGAESSLLLAPEGVPASIEEIISEFLLQHYMNANELPPVVYFPPSVSRTVNGEGTDEPPLDETIAWLREEGVESRVAVSGRPRSLLGLAESAANARLVSGGGRARSADQDIPVLEDLRKLLSLPKSPFRIEGVDISILQGVNAVGSLVVFDGGEPSKSEYRRFRIKSVRGMDDFAMVREVVGRRMRRIKDEGGRMPDLLLIDGGPGQVSAAMEALKELGLESLPLVGLAKREEEVFQPGKQSPLRADKNSPPVLLLRHVRDEAHRFALAYHHKRRQMALRGQFHPEKKRRSANPMKSSKDRLKTVQ